MYRLLRFGISLLIILSAKILHKRHPQRRAKHPLIKFNYFIQQKRHLSTPSRLKMCKKIAKFET